MKPVRLFLRPVRALVRLALGDLSLSQSILSPRRGSVHVLFGDGIAYVGKRRVQVSRLYFKAVQ